MEDIINITQMENWTTTRLLDRKGFKRKAEKLRIMFSGFSPDMAKAGYIPAIIPNSIAKTNNDMAISLKEN